MPYAELSTGAVLHYIDTAPQNITQTPVVLIHGLLGIPEVDFKQLIAWLREDYRVIAPSLRGYGESTPKPRIFPYDFYQQDAADILALIETLELPQAHLMGYSDGGEVALLAAGNAPEHFRSVTVWGAVGYYGPAMRPIIQGYFPGDWISDEEKAAHGIANPAAFILGWVQAVKRIIDSGGDLSLTLADKITAPLLLMLGDQDRLNPAEYGRRFIERTPNGRFEMLPCGHPVHEQQWDAFRQVVGVFLAEIEQQAQH